MNSKITKILTLILILYNIAYSKKEDNKETRELLLDDSLYDLNFSVSYDSKEKNLIKDDTQQPTAIKEIGYTKNKNYLFMKFKYKEEHVYDCAVPTLRNDRDTTTKITNDTEYLNLGLSKITNSKNNCLYLKTNGWWTYEYCLFQHVKQIHYPIANQNKKEYSEYVLGIYNNDNSNKLVQNKANLNYYIKQEYQQGSNCELLSESKRRVLIQLHCISESYGQNMIIEIKEIETCVYLLVVHFKELCEIDIFKPKIKQINQINCYHSLAHSKNNANPLRKFINRINSNKNTPSKPNVEIDNKINIDVIIDKLLSKIQVDGNNKQ